MIIVGVVFLILAIITPTNLAVGIFGFLILLQLVQMEKNFLNKDNKTTNVKQDLMIAPKVDKKDLQSQFAYKATQKESK